MHTGTAFLLVGMQSLDGPVHCSQQWRKIANSLVFSVTD